VKGHLLNKLSLEVTDSVVARLYTPLHRYGYSCSYTRYQTERVKSSARTPRSLDADGTNRLAREGYTSTGLVFDNRQLESRKADSTHCKSKEKRASTMAGRTGSSSSRYPQKYVLLMQDGTRIFRTAAKRARIAMSILEIAPEDSAASAGSELSVSLAFIQLLNRRVE